MKLAGALVLLGAALLLSSGGDCGICPAIKQDITLLLHGTPEEYIEYVKKYKDDPETLENVGIIKKCIDSNLTEKDKALSSAFMGKVEASPKC